MGYGGIVLVIMPNLSELIQHGAANLWLFIPTAILLGALHGLEPGHSKTMMAAFIIAVRGTVGQAILLGMSAAFSHSLIIWVLAAVALHFGPQWNAETTEPYLQIASAVMILGLAAWMFWRTRRDVRAAAEHHHHHHHHDGDGPQGGKMIDTGHGWVEVSVYETNVPPRFRLHFYDDAKAPTKASPPGQFNIEILRPDGKREKFTFDDREEFLEATAELGEPHEFEGKLTMAHGDHAHGFTFHFAEDHEHHHHHHHHEHGPESAEYQDAHEKAHAADIEKRFAGRSVTTSQIVFFGLTGGLIPCPASLTVLLVCLQLKKFTLGFTLVLCFSFGLAATMVMAGVLAALSARHAAKHFSGFGEFARRAPYFSCVLLVLMGVIIGYQGWSHLPR